MINDSKHFTVEKVADGVWTTLHKQGGSHICNSGIIDLGDKTLVFDTGLCLESARDLKETSTRLTGKTPRLVVNSHLHNDHFYGNQVFNEAETITSKENVRITIPKWKKENDRSYIWAKNCIEDTRKLLESESEYQRGYAKIFLGYLQGIIDVAPVLHYTPNEVTFDDYMRLEGSEKSVEIIEYRDGHSESDCVLLLSDDGVVFTGDLCTVGFHPCLDMGDPLNTLDILDELKNLGADTVVPGHGFIGTVTAFDNTKEYILTLVDLVEEVMADGGSLADAESLPVPRKYQEYQMRDFFYKRNLRKIYKALKE